MVAYLAYRQSIIIAKKSDETGKKVDEVHVLANSNLAKVSTDLAVANQKILGLEKLLTEIANRAEPVSPARAQERPKKKTRP